MLMKWSQGGKVNYQVNEYLLETEEDLKLLSNADFGDTAYIIETGDVWIMDSKKKWHIMGGDTVKPPVACDCVDELTIWQDMKNAE